MRNQEVKIKLSYVTGLRPVVLRELAMVPGFHLMGESADSLYLEFTEDALMHVRALRSVARAYVVSCGEHHHPVYISNHKSILGNLIDRVFEGGKKYQSFKISCAGSDSPEVRDIARYVQETYSVTEQEEADLKIHLIKTGAVWEVGVQITPRPLSVRDYREINMSGAMDPTVAYAVNALAGLEKARSYLNVFSGSGTLLIEAGQCYPDLEKLVGFDKDKKHLSLSIQNIRKAGLIERVEVKNADIFDMPDLGTFDVIVSDLPFGMLIGKNEDLNKLYGTFIEYCERFLAPGGRVVMYTSEHETLLPLIARSKFEIIHTLDLRFMTSVNAYLRPKIIACEFRDQLR